MNESELVAETIATVKRDGWNRYRLRDDSGTHCILGAIGRARWGEQWDIDCVANEVEAFDRLKQDDLTSSLVSRLKEIVVANGAYFHEDNRITVYRWNDVEAQKEDVFEVLEKVQAEVG